MLEDSGLGGEIFCSVARDFLAWHPSRTHRCITFELDIVHNLMDRYIEK